MRLLKIHIKMWSVVVLVSLVMELSLIRDIKSEQESSSSVEAGKSAIEEVKVWGQRKPVKESNYSNPESILTPEDMLSINAATTEDLVKYEPNLVIRRRFIGDSNGTLGMRGSNMFQTSRSMVFADGVPLHYFLQTRWSGAPRWSLVSADEIARVEVVYGPYSAEYSGNAMGGVVNIETAIPTGRRFHVEGSLFNQGYDELGVNDDFSGYKGFFSYGDRFDKLSVYFSYNRLENEGQPQSFLFSAANSSAAASSSTGALSSTDAYGNTARYYGDSGPAEALTDHLKMKVGYEIGKWSLLFNAAYENRDSIADAPNNYLSSTAGAPIWNGPVVQDGYAFNVRSSDFAVNEQDRRSLLLGGRLQGALSDDWWLEANISSFAIVEDESRNSNSHPEDPAYTPAGRVTIYDDTGWKIADMKFQNDRFLGNSQLSFVTGWRYEQYSLEISDYNSNDYRTGTRTALNNASGGKAMMQAAFAQLGWQVNDIWDLTLGGRYEHWESKDGFFNLASNPDDDLLHPDRSENRFSPKFSAGYKANDHWHMRYSLAKAYRFPIVEELFQNVRRIQSISNANASLEPEDGLHHNIMLQRDLGAGYMRFNLFQETVKDVIFAQTGTINNITVNTFMPVDEVDARGIEYVYNQFNVLHKPLDLRFNVAYTDAKIIRNIPNPAIEGKILPRMPEWRANLLMTYHLNPQWDIGGGVLYASDHFNDLDNADSARNVFGAHDAYTFINIKAGYRASETLRLNAGIDNLTDEIAFVHHPWPARTFFIEGALDF